MRIKREEFQKIMKRRIADDLLWWKNLGNERMPLLLYGARQIGKTYQLQRFGEENYKNSIYMNFEAEPMFHQLFADSINPDKLLPKIERFFDMDIIPGETLLIFDEIQSCNRALTSLKYFCEQAPRIDVVAAGSLLGVHTSATDFSFPVGKVITKVMYPLTFEEFLWESDLSSLAESIENCYKNDKPMEDGTHRSLLELYKEYLVVGGMPLSIYHYFRRDKALTFKDIQGIIVDTYISDMTKYSEKSQSIKTINTYESIVSQLAKDNKKFQYKLITKGARASLYGESIDWLIRAGVVLQCTKITSGDIPPAITKDDSSFKLYMSDVGLLSHKAGITRVNMDIFDHTFLGGITENYVANQLAANGYELFYWSSDSKAEVDFVIVKDDKIIPIEVKSGENIRSFSLNAYCKRYNPEYAIRVSGKNFGFENGIKSVPLYAAYLI